MVHGYCSSPCSTTVCVTVVGAAGPYNSVSVHPNEKRKSSHGHGRREKLQIDVGDPDLRDEVVALLGP